VESLVARHSRRNGDVHAAASTRAWPASTPPTALKGVRLGCRRYLGQPATGPSVPARWLSRARLSRIASRIFFTGQKIATYEPECEVTRLFISPTSRKMTSARKRRSTIATMDQKSTASLRRPSLSSLSMKRGRNEAEGQGDRIDDRDVLFEVNDKTYSIHGQNFAERCESRSRREAQGAEVARHGGESQGRETGCSEEKPKDVKPRCWRKI